MEIAHSIGNHRRVVVTFVIAWAVVWAMTVLTWHFDANGRSQGMPAAVFLVHLALPFAAAVVVSLLSKRARVAFVAAIIVAACDFVILVGWDWMLHALGRVVPLARNTGGAGEAGEAAEFFVLFVVLGAFFGLVAIAITRGLRRSR